MKKIVKQTAIYVFLILLSNKRILNVDEVFSYGLANFAEIGDASKGLGM